MTILRVEQEALLRVLERPPSSSFQSSLDPSPISIVEDDYLLVDFPNKALQSSHDAALLRSLSDDEEDSVFTSSTTSLTDSETLERRVSFCEDLVTEEWTRPYTPKREVPSLYYSSEDTARFRQEYRMERKLMSELSMDPDAADKEELSALVASSCSTPSSSRHRISRVVVLHNDKLETFFDPTEAATPAPEALDFNFDNDSFWSGSITWY